MQFTPSPYSSITSFKSSFKKEGFMNRINFNFTVLVISAALGLLNPLGVVAAESGRVLVVVSGANYLDLRDGKIHSTGYFLSELATPVQLLMKLGYVPTFVTPGGVAPTIDPVSDDPKWFASQEEYQEARTYAETQINHPLRSLESIAGSNLDRFDALFVPGGHAAMEDLPKSEAMGRVLRYFHSHSKPTALICHGPTALESAGIGADWIYSGYQMTVFSTDEEKTEESNGVLGGSVIQYPEDSLANLGGVVSVASPWTSNVVQDRELITGQNPMSDVALAQTLIEALTDQKLKTSRAQSWDGSTQALQSSRVLNIAGNGTDWSGGYTTFYLGLRKNEISQFDFLNGLASHIEQCKQLFGPVGMDGYIVIASEDLEVAYQHWTSQAAAEQAFAQYGATVTSAASQFMSSAVFKQINI
jgi:putative intracellular protease/amidase